MKALKDDYVKEHGEEGKIVEIVGKEDIQKVVVETCEKADDLQERYQLLSKAAKQNIAAKKELDEIS